MNKERIEKIALAYSGGLDTSIIIPWLKENYNNAGIIAVCVDVGQNDDFTAMEQKALNSGAEKFCYIDAREEFVKDYLFPMLRAGAIYEGKYLLGTSIARPLQAKHQVGIALKEQADALAHGCTGKGNDQVRFELTYKALAPHLAVITPWRLWDLTSREEAIDYAIKKKIPLGDISKKNIYSRDWNIWHMSHEGAELEDPWQKPKASVFKLTKSPQESPDAETEVAISFVKGMPVAIDGKQSNPQRIVTILNNLGAQNGIGRADIVETRTVGMKCRGVYETPGGTILNTALRELEMLTIDHDTLQYKKMLAIKYADLIYRGKWFSHLRLCLETFMQKTCEYVTGTVKLILYKGNIIIGGRKSPYSLYSEDLASFGKTSYDHKDATGFIKLFGLDMEVGAKVHKENK